MNIFEIINSLNKNEQKSLYNFITRSSKDNTSVKIYKLLKQSYSDRDVIASLDISPNLYRRLKYAVAKECVKGISVLYFDYNNVIEGLNYLIVAKTLKTLGKVYNVESFLKKAEKKLGYAPPSILYFLYSEWIDLYTEYLYKNPNEIIQKRKNIKQQLIAISEIDDELSLLIYEIHRSQNFSSNKKLLHKIESILKKTQNNSIKSLPQVRLKYYETLSKLLQQKKDYQSLVAISKQTIGDFDDLNWFNESNFEYKLKMRINVINSLFLLGNLVEALQELNNFKLDLSAYKAKFYSRYCFFYYNGLVMIFSQTDKHKAINTLTKALKDKEFTNNPTQTAYAYLNLAIQYFDVGNYRQATKALSQTMFSEYFQKFDTVFQIKIQCFELLLHYQKKDFDYCESLISKIKRRIKQVADVNPIANDIIILNYIEQKVLFKPIDKNIIIKKIKANYKRSELSDIIQYDIWVDNDNL